MSRRTNRADVRYELCGGNRAAFFDTGSQELLLAGPAGTGKAQPVSEPVMTPNGPRAMGDVRVGSLVLAPDGTSSTVTGVFPQGECDVYRVRFSCGRVVRCTADHLWTVWRLVGKSSKGAGVRPEPLTLTTEQIVKTLTTGRKNPRLRYWVAPPAPAAFDAAPVPVPPYVLGVWIGDGSPVAPRRGAPQFTSTDQFIVDEMRREAPSEHRVDRIGEIQYRITSLAPRVGPPHPQLTLCSRGVRMAVRAFGRTRYVGTFPDRAAALRAFDVQPESQAPVFKPLHSRITELGLGGCLAHQKFVPAVYKYNSTDVRLALVQGLMDTDGTVDRKTGMPAYCTTSRALARDFRFLIESLGGGVTIRAKRTARRVAFICHVRYDDPAALFRLPRKKSLCKKRTKYPFRRWIESVRHEGRERCQCISVSHPSRLYLTRGFVPTHNTLATLMKVRWFAETYANARILIARKTRVSLTETALVTWERDVLREGHYLLQRELQRANRQSYQFKNGSVVVTAGMDKSDKILSSEWDVIYCNEATELEETEWETLGSRLRANAGPFDQLIGDCNPTSPKHWLYKRCKRGQCKLYATHHYENPRYYDYRARQWTEAGRRYVHGRLKQLTGSRRDRFLYGKWVAAEGVVYDYDPEVHDLSPLWKPPAHWPRVWSFDWGDSAPTVMQIWAVDPEGRMYHTREVFRTRMRSDLLGEWARKELDSGREPLPHGAVCDHDAEKAADFMRACPAVHLQMADKADRGEGIQAMQARFDRDILGHRDGEPIYGKPRIFFAPEALVHEPDGNLIDAGRPTSTVDEIVGYVWDPKFVKDTPIAENDHGCFVAGTLVATARGAVPIEDVRAGDEVWTRAGLRPVVAAGMTAPAARVMRVQFDNGVVLTGTANHPVWARGAFVPLADLRECDVCVGIVGVGESLPVLAGDRVTASASAGVAPVFNLTVADVPEYFANGVLVHNCDAARYAVRYVDAHLNPFAPGGIHSEPGDDPPLPSYFDGGVGSATGW